MHADGAHTPWGEVTRLLHAARGGDDDAMERIVPLVYDDLRVLASRQLRRELAARAMEEQEIATSLGVTERTVRRDWVKARAWLYRSWYGTSSD